MAKKNKAKKKAARSTEIKFQIWVYYNGYSHEKDDEIREAAGDDDFGSGFGGERDISFFAQNKAHAMSMKDRILKVKGVSRVEFIDNSNGDAEGCMVFGKAGSKGVFRRYPLA